MDGTFQRSLFYTLTESRAYFGLRGDLATTTG